MNDIQLHFNQETTIFYVAIAFENVVCEISAILLRHQYVLTLNVRGPS